MVKEKIFYMFTILKIIWLTFINLIDYMILRIFFWYKYVTYTIRLTFWAYILIKNNPSEYQLSYFDKRMDDIADCEDWGIAYMKTDVVIAEIKACIRELKEERNGRNTNK